MNETRMKYIRWFLSAALVILAVASSRSDLNAGIGDPGCSEATPTCSGKDDSAPAILEKAFMDAKQTGQPAHVVVEPENPRRVQVGDLVQVQYTASLEDGSIIRTTSPETLKNGKNKRVMGFEEIEIKGPEEVVAGKPGSLPGLSLAVLESSLSTRKTVKIPAEQAFGPSDPRQYKAFPCEKRVPLQVQMTAREYLSRYDSFPVTGKIIQFNPYLKAKIKEVAESHAGLEILADDGKRIDGPIGQTLIKIVNGEARLMLAPVIGAVFETENAKGRVVSTNGTIFTVDFNHPLAGKDIIYDLGVVSLSKASAFKAPLPWIDDHDRGLKAAKSEMKNTLLVLYAGWCSWSKKLLTESMEDPRIKQMKDQFVWVKVDSDKEQAFKEAYQQEGFPMMVVLNSKGDVLKKIDGYRDAAALKKELEGVL